MDLHTDIARLKSEVHLLRSELNKAQAIIASQSAMLSSLQARLDCYDRPKNSRNSSIPPSQDYSRPSRNRSLRESSGKNPGGQPGRKGKTLKMVNEKRYGWWN